MSVEDISKFIDILRATADRLEHGLSYGGLTGVVLVLDAVPGTFVQDEPLTATWVSPQGGQQLYNGLVTAIVDVAVLRDAKQKGVH